MLSPQASPQATDVSGEAASVSEQDLNGALKELFSRCMNVAPADLNDEDSFFSLGLTSLIHTEILRNLTRPFPELSSTVLFEYPNFKLLSQHLEKLKPLPEQVNLLSFAGEG